MIFATEYKGRSPINKGFTLLELLIVIALKALLFIVILPLTSQFRNTAKVRGVSKNMSTVQGAAQILVDDFSQKSTFAQALTTKLGDSIRNPINNSTAVVTMSSFSDPGTPCSVLICYTSSVDSKTSADNYFSTDGSSVLYSPNHKGSTVIVCYGSGASLNGTGIYAYNENGSPSTASSSSTAYATYATVVNTPTNTPTPMTDVIDYSFGGGAWLDFFGKVGTHQKHLQPFTSRTGFPGIYQVEVLVGRAGITSGQSNLVVELNDCNHWDYIPQGATLSSYTVPNCDTLFPNSTACIWATAIINYSNLVPNQAYGISVTQAFLSDVAYYNTYDRTDGTDPYTSLSPRYMRIYDNSWTSSGKNIFKVASTRIYVKEY